MPSLAQKPCTGDPGHARAQNHDVHRLPDTCRQKAPEFSAFCRKKTVPPGLEIGLQHHPVAGFASADMLQRRIDLAHREHLDLGTDVVTGSERHQLAQVVR